MNSLPKALRILGILLVFAGVGGTGYFYRQMKVENLKHARTGDIPVRLGAPSAWESAGFNVFREGTHLVILTVHNGARIAPGPLTPVLTLDLQVADATGRMVLATSGVVPLAAVPPADSTTVAVLGSFPVALVGDEPWTLKARVVAGDSAMAGLGAELSVLPPQLYDIGDYLTGKIMTLLAMGAMALAGFIMIVVSASIGRRQTGPAA
jgi:hypothetical protein